LLYNLARPPLADRGVPLGRLVRGRCVAPADQLPWHGRLPHANVRSSQRRARSGRREPGSASRWPLLAPGASRGMWQP